jgi:hypothetical protein
MILNVGKPLKKISILILIMKEGKIVEVGIIVFFHFVFPLLMGTCHPI